MPFTLICDCGHCFNVEDRYAGIEVPCPACGDPVDVPKPEGFKMPSFFQSATPLEEKVAEEPEEESSLKEEVVEATFAPPQAAPVWNVPDKPNKEKVFSTQPQVGDTSLKSFVLDNLFVFKIILAVLAGSIVLLIVVWLGSSILSDFTSAFEPTVPEVAPVQTPHSTRPGARPTPPVRSTNENRPGPPIGPRQMPTRPSRTVPRPTPGPPLPFRTPSRATPTSTPPSRGAVLVSPGVRTADLARLNLQFPSTSWVLYNPTIRKTKPLPTHPFPKFGSSDHKEQRPYPDEFPDRWTNWSSRYSGMNALRPGYINVYLEENGNYIREFSPAKNLEASILYRIKFDPAYASLPLNDLFHIYDEHAELSKRKHKFEARHQFAGVTAHDRLLNLTEPKWGFRWRYERFFKKGPYLYIAIVSAHEQDRALKFGRMFADSIQLP